jgi:hypothetical protein
MQSHNPGEFTHIYALQVILGTNPAITQEQAEEILKHAVVCYMDDVNKRRVLTDTTNRMLEKTGQIRFYVDTGEFNIRGKDPRKPMMQLEDAKRADEFAEKGTLKHYLLRKGYFPDNEQVAEAILDRIIQEHNEMQ